MIVATGALVGAAPSLGAGLPFSSSIRSLTSAERQAMTPSVWRKGCPVSLDSLRMIRARHWNMRGQVRIGRLVVHRDVAPDVVSAIKALYTAKFPIRYMVPIERFGGNDFRSIEADNTSAFNCRYVEGTRRWSNHAYGRAIDINPIENPYVTRAGRTSHTASVPYLDRTNRRPGMLFDGSPVVTAFDSIGWGWGGRWSGVKDYQHVSETGR